MPCRRCKGLMVQEWCSELFSWEDYVWKCVNCGAMVDPVINQNRQNRGLASPEPRTAVSSRR